MIKVTTSKYGSDKSKCTLPRITFGSVSTSFTVISELNTSIEYWDDNRGVRFWLVK